MIEPRYIEAPHGPYQVAIDSVASTALQNGGSGNVAAGVSSIPVPFIGPAVGAFNYLHAGKNAVIRPGFRFVVVPVGNLARAAPCAL